ncbi:hypothetical protein MUN81_17980 [Hymenobacter sp. 5317J-9]|uniref:hypothetical protein n=1 Tax=Hymenobacter sp. 5317J-9 TaxID=2932250 RepID=UPI001FD63E7B|nr:hypothetical protein [Hymenobacter sp. 5317J-9]UOQ97116.1 hypothetical protein MUN81_17980 [Hymenobacter sp. 5317J-9]
MSSELGYLHDATLTSLAIQWQEGTLTIKINLYEDVKNIIIKNLSSLTLTRDFSWGESFQINEFLIDHNRIRIELQSGDVITIIGELAETEVPK